MRILTAFSWPPGTDTPPMPATFTRSSAKVTGIEMFAGAPTAVTPNRVAGRSDWFIGIATCRT